MIVNVLLFPQFETLDVFGPVEIFGKLPDCRILYYSESGGLIGNSDGVQINTQKIELVEEDKLDILFIPGGLGTRQEVNSLNLIQILKHLGQKSQYVLTVCTGSALLSKTGLLDGLKATSNKRSFEWVKGCNNEVEWIGSARWVVDGKYYTSSGISAGIDMTLGFVADIYGRELAEQIAKRIEYGWNSNKGIDDFAV